MGWRRERDVRECNENVRVCRGGVQIPIGDAKLKNGEGFSFAFGRRASWEGRTFRTPRIHCTERWSFPFDGMSLLSLGSLACRHTICLDVSYLKKSCSGFEEFLTIVGIGGVRSRLTGRSFSGSKLSIVNDPQGFERYIDPSNGSRRVDMVTRKVWYETSRRGGE